MHELPHGGGLQDGLPEKGAERGRDERVGPLGQRGLGAGTDGVCVRDADRVAAGAQGAGLRAVPAHGPPEGGRVVLFVPLAHRHDAGGVPREGDGDGVLPGLPSQPGEAPGGHVGDPDHGPPRGGGAAGERGPDAGGGVAGGAEGSAAAAALRGVPLLGAAKRRARRIGDLNETDTRADGTDHERTRSMPFVEEGRPAGGEASRGERGQRGDGEGVLAIAGRAGGHAGVP
ncbi:hypothetical protein QM565_18560 [Geitlerinema splendidum]|nr:hypothetical protein [Geitlerinema splendidum]